MHTPGPWAVDHGNTDGHIKSLAYVESERYRTPTVARYDMAADSVTYEERIANAHLIAAAPELLASLEFVAKWFVMREGKGERFPSQLTDSVKAAIAKAKGETP